MAASSELEELIGKWCRERGVRAGVLFGSRASGKAQSTSDYDLAVWPAGPVAPAALLRWVRELEELVQADVSLVLVGPDLDPVLGFEISRQGRLLYEAQPGLWPDLRAQLWHAYEDSLPFRRAAEELLHKAVREATNDA